MLLSVALLPLSSCEKADEETPNQEKPSGDPETPPATNSIVITTQGEVAIPAEGGSSSIEFTAGGDWTAAVEGSDSAGGWYVCAGLNLSASDQFKFRKDHDWAVNYGAGPDVAAQPYIITIGAELPAGAGGNNLAVPRQGIYDLLLNPTSLLYKVQEHVDGAYSSYTVSSSWGVSGSIASTGNNWNGDEPMYSYSAWLSLNPASGNKDVGRITVTATTNTGEERIGKVVLTCGTKTASINVRQPEAKSFIADFQNQYKIGPAAQTLELKSRANVELAAE